MTGEIVLKDMNGVYHAFDKGDLKGQLNGKGLFNGVSMADIEELSMYMEAWKVATGGYAYTREILVSPPVNYPEGVCSAIFIDGTFVFPDKGKELFTDSEHATYDSGPTNLVIKQRDPEDKSYKSEGTIRRVPYGTTWLYFKSE